MNRAQPHLPPPQIDENQALAAANNFSLESAQVYSAAQQSRVLNDADYANAGQYLIYVVGRRKAAAEFLAYLLSPLEEYIKRVKGAFAPTIEQYNATERYIRSEMNAHQQRENARRAALRAEAEQAAGGGDAGAFVAAMVVAQQPRPSAPGVSTTVVYKYEVTDIDKLPPEYVVKTPNRKALNDLARASKGEAKVEGVRFWAETTVVARG